jgi:hypothetical protein
LIDSVVPLVKMISRSSRALMKRAPAAGGFVLGGRLLAQVVHGAVDVRVLARLIAHAAGR